MIRERVHFQSSINIRFDLGKEELINRYLPTPSHAESLTGLLKGFLNEGNHAHIIVGPYGSGKSLMATVVADLVSNVRPEALHELAKRFQTVHSEVYEYIVRMEKIPIKYIPVVLTGSGASLRQNLLSSMYKTLRTNEIDLSMPVVVSEIQNIVEIWENNYTNTYVEFLARLQENNWSFDSWYKDIQDYNLDAIDWFKGIYPGLTSGSQLTLSYDHDIVTHISYILRELSERGMGLFIIYDEFGRLLQTLDSFEIHATMQDLQDLAELANHNQYANLNVLLITHRNFGQYALRFNEEILKEFQRIEKRYNAYFTQTDRATFIRLASLVTEQYRSSNEERFVRELRHFTLFPELTYHEMDTLILRGAYPIHPVALFVIPQLANLVGQNERTLFTFLESDDFGGLRSHLRHTKDWYTVDLIFDYFESAISEFEKDSMISQTYSLFNRLQRKLIGSDQYADESRVLKLIALWNMVGLNSQQALTSDLISFALIQTDEITSKVLSSLQKKKIIRFNVHLGYWNLFEGSSVDVDNEVNKRLNRSLVSKRQKMDFLERVLLEKFVLPKHYNDIKSMTRFASVHPVLLSELQDGSVTTEQLRMRNESDAVLVYVIDDSSMSMEQAEQLLIELSLDDAQAVFVLAFRFTGIEKLVDNLLVVNDMLQDKYLLAEDKYLKDELEQIERDTQHQINEIVTKATDVSDCQWIYHGDQVRCSRRSFGKRLSDIMMTVFPKTPEIRNESFNRRKVTKVQQSGAIKVVDSIIECDNKDVPQIVGFGPDYLIYATVVKNTGINLLGETDEPNLRALRQELLKRIKKGKGRLVELLNVFSFPPFGIRTPLIPVLLVSILKREWRHILFYNNLIYNPDVDGELLYYMVQNPDNYTFTYQVHDAKHDSTISVIEQQFSEYVDDEERTLPSSVFVTRILLRWLRSLPKITQGTRKTSPLANQFKEIVRKGEVEPVESLEALFHMLQECETVHVLKDIRHECENFFDKHKEFIEVHIYGTLNVETYEELVEWARSQSTTVRLTNPLVKTLLVSDQNSLVDDLSDRIVGVRRENWSDTTDQLFISQIGTYLRQTDGDSMQQYIEVKVGDSSYVVPDVKLSDKSLLIYQNTRTNLKLMGRTVAREEIQRLLVELLNDFVTNEA